MDKKKKKKKKKADDDEKTEQMEQEPEGPTEKDLFQKQIDQLKRQLEDADTKLQEKRESLAKVKSQLECESDNEQAIVSYLKRVLQFENDRRMKVQEKLETLRDQAELMERRALGKFATTKQSREAAQSQFFQEKLELEGKLSLLEELRLKRNSQLDHLKEVEEALEDKIAALREKNREEDMRKIDTLLKSREQFLEKCRQMRQEWQEAFRLRMPVHAKKQLQENVHLRQMCDKATERLLQVQEQNRNLKMLQKSLDLEEEIQASAEKDARKRKISQEKQLRQLLLAGQKLQLNDVQRIIQRLPENDNDVSKKCIGEGILQQDIKLKEEPSSEVNVKRKIDNREDFLGQNKALREIATHEGAEKQKAKVDEGTSKYDIKDAVKLNIEAADGLLVTNNMLQELPLPEDAVKQKTDSVDHILKLDNKLRKVYDLEKILIENGKQILKKGNNLKRLFNPEDAHNWKTKEEEGIMKKDNGIREESISEGDLESNNDEDILEQTNVLQEISIHEGVAKEEANIEARISKVDNISDVKLNLAAADGLLLTNNVLQEVLLLQDEVKEKIDIIDPIHEKDDKLRKFSEPGETLKENGERIFKKDNNLQGLFNPKDAQKWKAVTNEDIGEQVNKQQIPMPHQEILSQNIEENTHDNRQQQELTFEHIVKQRMEAIAVDEEVYFQLLDKCEDLMAVLNDQARYKQSLEEDLEQNVNKNGSLMSVLLRARKVFESRCGKLRDETRGDMDYELLQQTRFLLDMASNES